MPLASILAIFFVLLPAWTVWAMNVATPIEVPFNFTHHFGYDGPWQAIPVLVSNPQQLVNLYPGGTYATCIPSINVGSFIGNYTSDSFPSEAGIFDLALAQPSMYGSSQNYEIFGPGQGGTVGAVDGSLNGGRPSNLTGEGLIITDSLSWGNNIPMVLNVSISAIFDANYTLPNGTSYPLDVGFLSLGASNNQFFDPYVASVVPLNLSATGVIPSNAWGMHIGSVFPNVPPSLILGGYDQSRVIGDVSTLPAQNTLFDMIINLLDVSIGVETGATPFPFAYRSGLLTDAGQTVSQLNVRPNPTVPYLYLPMDSCKAITSYLPVTYLQSLDLYLWDTTSPDYQKIVTSPSYLAFTFQTNGSPGNMTVKVPFALLNLTLTPPLVDQPTPYFPCKSYAPSGSNSQAGNEYHLGRAFLQAAFIGMNWNQDTWWMAQAPGPRRLQSYVVQISNSTTKIQSAGASSVWADSWSDILTPLPISGENVHETGMSRSAKTGIVVGAVLGGLVLLGIIVFVSVKHWQKQKRLKGYQNGRTQTGIQQENDDVTEASRWRRHELEDQSAGLLKQSTNLASVPREQMSELPSEHTRN